MRILMRQRLLSILDHYDVCDEAGQKLFHPSFAFGTRRERKSHIRNPRCFT